MPGEYIEYVVMREMGWSYQELMECPYKIVVNIIRYLNTEAKFYKRKVKHGRT